MSILASLNDQKIVKKQAECKVKVSPWHVVNPEMNTSTFIYWGLEIREGFCCCLIKKVYLCEYMMMGNGDYLYQNVRIV